MSELIPFTYEGSKVRVVEIGGEPWFVLNDLTAVLEISNSRMVAQRLHEGDVSQTGARKETKNEMEKSKVPRKQTRGGLWDEPIPPDLARAMRNNPAQTFQLTGDSGKPAAISRTDSAALSRSAPKPFRVQSRSVRAGGHKTVLVWVSMDPGHSQQLQEAKK